MNIITYEIPGISCNHCVNTIQMELSELAGVESVTADALTKEVTVAYCDPASPQSIEKLLAEINYPVKK